MRMMKAVQEQTSRVSVNTPNAWIRPCFTGWLTVAVAATLGALSLAVEGCVYGPPPETNVYGPPPDFTRNEETVDTQASKPSKSKDDYEVCVYGPAPDPTVDGPEVDVYGPAPDVG